MTMKKTLIAMGVISALSASTSVFAVDASAEARIAALEAQLAELKQMLSGQIQEQKVLATKVQETSAKTDTLGGFDVKVGGYIKLDAMWSSASDGDPSGIDFYYPAKIPTGGEGESGDLDMQAKESRINFSAKRSLDGHNLMFFTELDFFGGGGNEAVSNSANPRIRHAFFKYDNWLFGQTWSTFQDVAALADNLDFIGPSEGTTFVRQAQIRYSSGGFDFAIENPETRITNGASFSDDGSIPDIVARYTTKGDWGHFAVAGLYRDLTWDNGSKEYSDTAIGLSASGKILIGNAGSDLRFMLTSGSGVGRYLGISTALDAIYDAANDDIETIDSLGGFVSYRHAWNSKWHSNFTYSVLDIDNDVALSGSGAVSEVSSIHANLLYSPTAKTTFGIEYMTAERETEAGDKADLDRVIVSAKYAF